MSTPPNNHVPTDDPTGEITNALNAYNAFDLDDGHGNMGPKARATHNLNTNLNNFVTLIDKAKDNPELVLAIFFSMIMVNGTSGQSVDGVTENGSSFTNQEENQITEVSDELNYLSAFRDTISDIKAKFEDAKAENPNTDEGKTNLANDLAGIKRDLQAIDNGRASGAFGPGASPIMQDSDKTFTSAESDINSVLNQVGPGNTYSDLNDLWNSAGQIPAGQSGPTPPPSGTNTDKNMGAGGLIQTFTNATDSLFSAVGVQQNVLNTQLQDIEADYKSNLSVASQAMKSFFSIIDASIQKQIAG
jgi:hypothetical protein